MPQGRHGGHEHGGMEAAWWCGLVDGCDGGCCKEWMNISWAGCASSCAILIMLDGGSGFSRLGSCRWWTF